MKRMLFNATQAEELRVAIVDGQKLIDLDIESAAKEQRKSNIYKAIITRIEPGLEAAFVDYGAERHGFLPFKEVTRAYFQSDMDPGRAKIQDALKVGQEIIVQVEKDERGNKGAALTTFVSLAGRYLVLMPNNPRGGGVSRRVEGEERQELRDVLDQLDVPNGMSLIARTAAINRTAEELQWDMNYLLQLWTAIDGAAKAQSGAFLIYQESSLVIRAIRDYFQPDIGEILIDTDDIFAQAQQFMEHVMPNNVARVKRYRDDVPLFSRFQIEHQIESAYSRQVGLPSGGAIVIDHTEALVAVDVNSGRATKGSDIEETALRTNLEAADEVARQLRLRDLGGLIVIDFIDMDSPKSQREVENRLRDALHYDRARVQVSKISRFGLLELSRQRLRPALAETSYITCPRCTGTGHIRSTESAALHILRILEEEAMKENTGAIHAQVPVDVGTFLLNEKRIDIARIELRHRIHLLIVPNRQLETPQHEIVRLRYDQLNADDITPPSYQMAIQATEAPYQPPSAQTELRTTKPEAAVKGITPEQPAPVIEPPAAKTEPSILTKILAWLGGSKTDTSTQTTARTGKQSRPRGERSDRERGERNHRNSRRDRNNREDREQSERKGRNNKSRREETAENQQADNSNHTRRNNENREARSDSKEPRAPRQTKAPRNKPQAAIESSTADKPTAVNENSAEKENNRRRGRRGGRSRSERREEGASVETETNNVALRQDTTSPTEQPQSTAPPADLASAPVTPLAVARTASKSVTVTAPTPAAETTPAVAEIKSQPAAVPAQVKHEQAAQAPVQPKPAPVTDVPANLTQAGLVLIETSTDRYPAAASGEVSQKPLGRKPKPATVIIDEPLKMVETKHE